MVKIVSRGDTTVVDAYLNPVLRAYIDTLRKSLGGGRLQILTSAGGLVDADSFVGKDSILSGPAGGVIGFSRVVQAAGFQRGIGFDMGGTSTDVSRFDGCYQREYETEKAGVRIVAPMMAIETVAAGGGSVCRFDGVKLVVGPQSAAADPGPACYGRGGPLAVTDMNFYQGKIVAEHFPFPLDRQVVDARLRRFAGRLPRLPVGVMGRTNWPTDFSAWPTAGWCKRFAQFPSPRGATREYVLVAFGGAAGQHACAVARELAISRIICRPTPACSSAYGIGMADVVRHRAAGVYQPFPARWPAWKPYSSGWRRGVRRSDWGRFHSAADRGSPAAGSALSGIDSYLTIPQPAEGGMPRPMSPSTRSCTDMPTRDGD